MFRSFFRKRRRALEKQQTTSVRAAANAWIEAYVESNSSKYSLAACREAVETHLLSALGERSIGSITRSEIEKIHDELEHDSVTANQFLFVATEIFRFSEVNGLRPKGTNPCIYVTAYPEDRPVR